MKNLGGWILGCVLVVLAITLAVTGAIVGVVLLSGCSNPTFVALPGDDEDDTGADVDELDGLLDVHKTDSRGDELALEGEAPSNDTGELVDTLEASSDTRDAIAVDTFDGALDTLDTSPAVDSADSSSSDAAIDVVSDGDVICMPHWGWCTFPADCCSGICTKGTCGPL